MSLWENVFTGVVAIWSHFEKEISKFVKSGEYVTEKGSFRETNFKDTIAVFIFLISLRSGYRDELIEWINAASLDAPKTYTVFRCSFPKQWSIFDFSIKKKTG